MGSRDLPMEGTILVVVWSIEKHWECLLWCVQQKASFTFNNGMTAWLLQPNAMLPTGHCQIMVFPREKSALCDTRRWNSLTSCWSLHVRCFVCLFSRTTSHLPTSMTVTRFCMKLYRPMSRIWSSRMKLTQHGVMPFCQMCRHCLLWGKCFSKLWVCINKHHTVNAGRS